VQATVEVQAPKESPSKPTRENTMAMPQRNVAVDAYRGLVMLLMMGEVMRFAAVAKAFPHSLFWHILAYNQTHVEWSGMGLHDTIQPGFTFLVGVALPYSLASRLKKGQSFGRLLAHTMWRSFLLIALGIFLRSKPIEEGPELRQAAGAHHVAQLSADCAWYFSAVDRQHADVLHL
jgi:heparan-alpha-glucosaminide N-acetyltransferase